MQLTPVFIWTAESTRSRSKSLHKRLRIPCLAKRKIWRQEIIESSGRASPWTGTLPAAKCHSLFDKPRRMAQLIDLYGLVAVILRGLTLVFQVVTAGAVIFLC